MDDIKSVEAQPETPQVEEELTEKQAAQFAAQAEAGE